MVETIDMEIGFQKTELGVLPDDWEVKSLDGEIDLLTGYPFSSKDYSKDGIRLLRGSNVKRGVTDWTDDITKYWKEVTSDLRDYVLKDGDIVIAMDGSLVGKSFARLSKSDLPALLLQRVARVRSETIDMGYLKEFICSEHFTKYCDSVKTVSAIPHISPKDIRGFKIPLPPTKEEQTAIATALNDADKRIAELEKLIVKKRNIRQGALQKLLSPKEGWEKKELGEIGDFKKGRNIPKISLKNEGIPCVLYGEIYTTYNYHSSQLVSRITTDTAKEATEINYGDILFAGSGETAEDIGKCFVYTGKTKAYAGGDVIILTPKNFDEIFLGFLLNSFDVIRQKSFLGQGSSVFHIYPYNLKSIEVSLPKTKDEQELIGKILLDMDSEIEALEIKLAKHKMIKQGMMQNLLTGKIRLV